MEKLSDIVFYCKTKDYTCISLMYTPWSLDEFDFNLSVLCYIINLIGWFFTEDNLCSNYCYYKSNIRLIFAKKDVRMIDIYELEMCFPFLW
jgi:hypothetical protein